MMEPDPRTLRAAFGSFATGVTIVTTRTPDGTPVGFTANSFTSVSLAPPMLLVCLGDTLSSHDVFARSEAFAISILAAHQHAIATTFARHKGDRFAATPHHDGPTGLPLITGAVAQFSCRRDQTLRAGDHAILIGAITDVAHTPGPTLGYAAGRFITLPDPSPQEA